MNSEKFFQPDLSFQSSKDEYLSVDHNGKEIALGFLRGWDADWDDICLGIIVVPEFRRYGFGEMLCKQLETIAQNRGLKRIRLHVDKNNVPAYSLYKKLGYIKTGIRENGELIMYKDLECE